MGQGFRDAESAEYFRRGGNCAADRNRAQRIATVWGCATIRNSSRRLANKRQQQGGLQTAKTRVVEHKGRDAPAVVFRPTLLAPRCLRRDSFRSLCIPDGMQFEK